MLFQDALFLNKNKPSPTYLQSGYYVPKDGLQSQNIVLIPNHVVIYDYLLIRQF